MNESLLAMSFDVNVNGNIDQHSDTLNNGDNHVEIENESSSKGVRIMMILMNFLTISLVQVWCSIRVTRTVR